MIVFMEHFEQVSKERNEEESSVNVRVIERVNDLRRMGGQGARMRCGIICLIEKRSRML